MHRGEFVIKCVSFLKVLLLQPLYFSGYTFSVIKDIFSDEKFQISLNIYRILADLPVYAGYRVKIYITIGYNDSRTISLLQ